MLRLPPEEPDEELEEDFVLRLPPEELFRTVLPLERLPPELPDTLPELVRLPPSPRTVVEVPPFFGVGVLRPPYVETERCPPLFFTVLVVLLPLPIEVPRPLTGFAIVEFAAERCP